MSRYDHMTVKELRVEAQRRGIQAARRDLAHTDLVILLRKDDKRRSGQHGPDPEGGEAE